MWYKDLKWKIIIALTIIVILGIIIGKKDTDEMLGFFNLFLYIGSIVGTQVITRIILEIKTYGIL
jgi:hypothetical protein